MSYICGVKRSRNRGFCQQKVRNEGDRCARHTEEKEAERAAAAAAEQDDLVLTDIDASSIEDLQKKLEPNLDMMKKLERSLRDPTEGHEGDDIYLAIARNNIVRMQIKAEANPTHTGLFIQIGNMIGQYKINEKRHLDAQRTRLEMVRLQRQIDAINTDKADVLTYMHMINRMLGDGFILDDPSPRRSYQDYIRWLGEDVTVDDVLEGRAEVATAPWEMQEEILTSLFWPEQLRWTAGELDANGEPIYHTGKPNLRYTICVTGNGMGKSYVSARCVLYNALFLYPSITIVTGPRLSQVRDTVSAEVRRKHNAMGLPGKPGVLRWQPNVEDDRSYVNYTSAQSDDAFAGHHGRILIIMEEASGVAAHIYESSHGLMSGADCRMLQIGNMHRRKDRFYEFYDKALKNPSDPESHLIQRGAYDHPNYLHRQFIEDRGGLDIYPHAVNAKWVDSSIERWGEDSHRTYTRIYGMPPKQDSNSMISLDLVETSVQYEYPEDGEDMFHVEYEVIFADIAGLGDNNTVIGRWQWGRTGHRVEFTQVMSHSDHSDVADAMLGAATRDKNDNLWFSCDTNGEGSGVLEMLIERGIDEWNTRGFKAAWKPERERGHRQQEEYADMETEAWARLRTWLRRSTNSIYKESRGDGRLRIDLPGEKTKWSDQMVRELTERDHAVEGGKVQLQPKREFKKVLGGESPDFAEAVVIGARMVWIAQQPEEFNAQVTNADYKQHISTYPVR